MTDWLDLFIANGGVTIGESTYGASPYAQRNAYSTTKERENGSA